MKARQMKAKLGEQYSDSITGFSGTAVARTIWLHGCDRISLERADKDGKPEMETFDEERLTGVKASKPGGPRPEPTRRDTPR